MAVCQNLVPLVNIKIAGKWIFIPLKMVFIGIDPYPNDIGENGAQLPSPSCNRSSRPCRVMELGRDRPHVPCHVENPMV